MPRLELGARQVNPHSEGFNLKVRDDCSGWGICCLSTEAQFAEEMRRLASETRLPLSSLG